MDGADSLSINPLSPRKPPRPRGPKCCELSQKRGLPSYLGVTKRHRPDKFLLTHAVDGFSFAMDFKITDRNRVALGQVLQDFDRIVLQAGGRFYFVKNSDTLPETCGSVLWIQDHGRVQAPQAPV